MTEFADKIVWITGASSGIGRALALELRSRGASLVLSGRRLAALEEVREQLDRDALLLPFEATDYAAAALAAEQAIAWRGGVDLLVNNAGISQRSLAIDTHFDVYRTLMEVDFFAPLRLTQLVLPHMVERRSGQIAVISSVAGKVGVPLRTGYCAAKHACTGYFDALRAEVETAYGIGVSVILPGSVQTNVAVNALSADGATRGASDANIDNGMAADEAARRIADGLAAGVREIVVAEGAEAQAVRLRAADPDAFFARVAGEGLRLAEARAAAGAGAAPEPAKIV